MPLNPEPAPEAAEMMVATAETEIPSPPPEADAPIVVRSLDFGGIHEVDEVRFWVAETSPEPRAILVLCLDPNDNPEAIARDGVWQEFARANRLTLLALSFKSDEKVLQAGRGYYRAELGAGASLLAATEQLSATALPLIVYGRGGGGAFGTSFAAWKPDRVLAWASYTAQWRVQPARATAMPPGLLVSDREEVKKSDAAEAFFTRGRAIQSPWTWLCLGGVWQERQAKLDDFVREYLAKCLSSDPSQSDSAWVGLETLKVIGPAERMAAPAKAAWLPAASLVPSWAALMRDKGHGKTARIVQKTVPTRNPRQPNLDLYLRLPPSAQEGKEVSGVLAFCTWEANQAAILSKLDMRSDDKPIDLEGPTGMVRAIIEFTEKHNLAILTWGTVDAWNNDLNTAELARKQQKESDRTFDLLATAWERGVKELGRETGIPQKNYLLYGVSRGAQWAHRLALRKPDYFLAVHVHIPSTFDKPTPEANKPLWLLTTGELEYGYERAQQFYAGCRAFGYPIIFKAIVGIGHSGSHIADALSVRFFEYALSVQDLREGYEKRRKDPFARNKEDPSAPWLESFRSPEFFGDLMNQECFPVAKLDQIPEPFRVPLPTKILAEAWNQ